MVVVKLANVNGQITHRTVTFWGGGVRGRSDQWDTHSPMQVKASAIPSGALVFFSLMHWDIFVTPVPQSRRIRKKGPEPWLNSCLCIFPVFPHFSTWQTASEKSFVTSSVATLCHLPSYWISTLPAHLPGPSTSLSFVLSAPWQKKNLGTMYMNHVWGHQVMSWHHTRPDTFSRPHLRRLRKPWTSRWGIFFLALPRSARVKTLGLNTPRCPGSHR